MSQFNSTVRARFCRLCANHNIQTPVSGHRGNCLFANCVCEKCLQVRGRNERERQRRNDQATQATQAATSTQPPPAEVLNVLNAGHPPTAQSAAARRAENTRKRREDERNNELNKHLNTFFSTMNKDAQNLPFMANIGRAFRNFAPYQNVLSFLVEEPKKEGNCPPTSVPVCGISGQGTGKTQAGTENGVDSSLSSWDPSNAIISFSGPTVPQVSSQPPHPFSLLLSDESGPCASNSNDVPGRRPHRCHYCGLEWPAFMDNSHCPQCYTPYNKRYRY